MKQDELELFEAGLDEGQIALLRQQHIQLRSEGQNTDMSTLALRSRFLNSDQINLNVDADQPILGGDYLSIQSILPLDICRRFSCVPLEFAKGVLVLKSSMPLSKKQLERIREELRIEVESIKLVAVSRQELLQDFRGFEQAGTVVGLVNALKMDGLEAGRLRSLVYALLKEALTTRASDIHLNRKPDPDAWITYRIDSVMRPTHLLPETLMQSLVARIKIEAGMDASNSRTAQDGRLSVDHQGRVVDFRISTQPLVDGESVVLRALDASLLPSLAALFPKQDYMLKLIRSINTQNGKTGGLVFISGATGSGKSTTQYTIACGFRRDAMNVITVEDPVEYVLPFAKQIQLQALMKQRAIELERSILRQDPDILIFGEIRDADSARAALAFAESGHTVISTIHANNALQVTERFLSMIDPSHREDSEFLIAHYMRLIIHQRLAKKLCSCSVPVEPEELMHLQQSCQKHTGGLLTARAGWHKAAGCSQCGGTGYKGRVAAHETIHIPNDEKTRGRFVKAFRSHAIELPVDLNEDNGVEFFSRLSTYQALLDSGVVDWPTVLSGMGTQE